MTLFERNAPLVGERWLADTSLGAAPHIDPNTGAAIAQKYLAGAREIDAAVRVAADAQRVWRAMAPDARQRAMQRWLALIQENDALLVALAARESGTPCGLGISALAHAWIAYYTGFIDKIGGEASSGFPSPGLNIIRREPYGVVGVIIPWNGPLVAIAMNCVPALAAGNAVVLKPPSLTPFVALKVGELALEAGLPPGLLCVVPGDAEAGEALCTHPGVAKIAFTGGEHVARTVMAQAARSVKPLFLELGGKSANIICGDADLDAALPLSAGACMALAGQGCVNPTRLLVHSSVYDETVARLQAIAGAMTVGSACETSTHVGPVISASALARISSLIGAAQRAGDGRLVFGGERLSADDVGKANAGGYFLRPAVFADVAPSSGLGQSEVFGPVLAVMRFTTDEEAVTIANDTAYGLGAYIQTRDLDRALYFSERLEAGYVMVNSPPHMNPNAPFGGIKHSGFGRVGGREGLEEFLQTKNVFIAARSR